MTPADTLRAAAEADDEAAIRALLADMPEADRAELAPVARPIVAAVKRRGIEGMAHRGTTMLMAYGLLPVSEIRTLGWRNNHLPQNLEEVLRARSAERLLPIVDFLCDDVGTRSWRVVRALVREGTVPRPDRPSYTISMLAATRYKGAAPLIADDPGLLDTEVWRLFEVEGGGEDSLANHEKFFGDTWGDVFRDLAARDAVDAPAAPRREPGRAGPRLHDLPSRVVLAVPRVARCRPTTSAPSAPTPTWDSSEAASVRRCRW